MAKAPDELNIGDIVFIETAKKYVKITNLKTFGEIWTNGTAIAANDTLDGQNIENLDSGTEEIYFVVGMELLRNIDVTSLMFRGRDLIGTEGTDKLTFGHYPQGCPYPLNMFMYNKKPQISVEEQAGIVLAANTELVRFVGVDLTVEETEKPEDNQFTSIPG